MAEATRAGLEAARPAEAPFVLTRAAHLATPRAAATWTGDNMSTWLDLRWSVSMVLGLGIVGQAMAGPDVGGFSGDPGPELFARWFEVGCYLPFFRGHADFASPRKEPWAYGPDALERVRSALRWRMRMLPYLEARFREASADGVPVVRPLFFAGPADPRLREVDDAFLVGPDLLVVPALEPDARAREVPLPPGRWRRVPVDALLAEPPPEASRERALEGPDAQGSLQVEVGPGPAPCFLRVGGRLPLAPVRRRPPADGAWPVLETLVAL
jgi:alpha-glucosidase